MYVHHYIVNRQEHLKTDISNTQQVELLALVNV